MRLPLTITIIIVICFAASCVKAQNLPDVEKTPTKQMQQSQATELTEDQAVEFAEKFIAQNGYTDLPPDKENLTYESIEWEQTLTKC